MIEKKQVVAALVQAGVIPQGFTGRIVVDLNQGGITAIERTEKLK